MSDPSVLVSRKSSVHAHSERVAVAMQGEARSVIATEAIGKGMEILRIKGTLVRVPSRYSVQVDDHLHIEPPADEIREDARDEHPWRFLNHACNPNAGLDGLRLVALRGIARGEQITFDYNTSEYEMATPFTCACGVCGGKKIRGFKFLADEERVALYPRLAAHLRRHLEGPGAR